MSKPLCIQQKCQYCSGFMVASYALRPYPSPVPFSAALRGGRSRAIFRQVQPQPENGLRMAKTEGSEALFGCPAGRPLKGDFRQVQQRSEHGLRKCTSHSEGSGESGE